MPTPLRVLPLVADLGEVDGQRLVVLALEVYDAWTDLRFARIDVGATRPIARRVPAAEAWRVQDDLGTAYAVVDAVGRGDRAFSNGEVRLTPTVADDAAHLDVEVTVVPGTAPLRGRLRLVS